MRLEMGTFPVTALHFGPATRYEAGYRALDGRNLAPQGTLKVELNPATAFGGPPPV